MPQPEASGGNRVCLRGVLVDIRERWTPDGSPAAIASLLISRPNLGAARATNEASQPIPLRATGRKAQQIAQHAGGTVNIEGVLRRRYYSREGEARWGQVEVWVDRCRPVDEQNRDHDLASIVHESP